jgi:hypothetical protein
VKRLLPATFLVFLTLTACSTLWSTQSAPEGEAATAPVESAELFLAHGSLLKNEFEQYRLSGTMLFFECGEYRRSRHDALEQDVLEISGPQLAAVSDEAARLLRLSERGANAPSPGTGTGFSDPGRLELTLKAGSGRLAIATSINWAVDSDGGVPSALESFAAGLRGLAKSRCGNQGFYGIGAGTAGVQAALPDE